jgi:hypothetical protein
MEHLNEQRSESADEHRREIAVDSSRHAVKGEVGLCGIVATRGRLLGEPDGAAYVAIDAAAQPGQSFTGHDG